VLQHRNYAVVSIGEFKNEDIVNKYLHNNIKVYDIKKVKNTDIIGTIINMHRIYNLVKTHDIKLICPTSLKEMFLCAKLAKILQIEILPIIPGGELKNEFVIAQIPDIDIICFSEENKEALIKSGHSIQKVHAIANRIDSKEDLEWITFYEDLKSDAAIRLLLVSRLDKGKLNSIEYVIELIQLLIEKGCNIELRIAGDGAGLETVKMIAQDINSKFNQSVIHVLGHVVDIEKEILNAHIVFGKGRSVIEPLMKNRIGIVIGEDKRCSVCNTKSFDNLYYYNFSGRNIKYPIDNQGIFDLIKQIRNHKLEYKNYYEFFNKVRGKYHTAYLNDQIQPILDNVQRRVKNISEHPKSNIDSILILFYGIQYMVIYGYGSVLRRLSKIFNRNK
jgi:hypothetical protein